MKDPYTELADRIRVQIPDLERLVERALLSWSRAKESANDQQLFLKTYYALTGNNRKNNRSLSFFNLQSSFKNLTVIPCALENSFIHSDGTTSSLVPARIVILDFQE